MPAQPPGPGPPPRGRLLKAGRARRRRRSWSYFVGQPWPLRLLHRSAGECGAPAGRSGAADGAPVSAQAWPGARRAAACPRVATPGRAPGGRPTTTGCCGGPGCSDRGAAPAVGPGPPGVGAIPTPDPKSLATTVSPEDALGHQGTGDATVSVGVGPSSADTLTVPSPLPQLLLVLIEKPGSLVSPAYQEQEKGT